MSSKSTQHPSGMLSIAMLATAGLLAAVSVGKVTRVFVVSSRLAAATDKQLAQAKPDPAQVEKALAQDKAMAEELKKSNLIAPSAPKRNPVQQVLGILGDEALIAGKWYKAGDKVQDANIVAIEATHVVVEWGGQRTNVSPIQAGNGGPQDRGPSRGRGGEGPRGGAGRPTMTVIGGQQRGGTGPFGAMSDEERQRMFERFRNMSPEERRAAREQFRGGQGGDDSQGGGSSDSGGGRDRGRRGN